MKDFREREFGKKGWNGVLASERAELKRAVNGILCLLVVALAVGQMGFFPLGGAHILFLLVPIAFAALLFGKWRASVIGILAGLAEMLHASVLPYDYFEKYFFFPLNSVVLYALFGLLIGVLLEISYRKLREKELAQNPLAKPSTARIGVLVAISLIGALFCTVFIQFGINVVNTSYHMQLPTELAKHITDPQSIFIQFVIDTAVLALALIFADVASQRLGRTQGKQSLQTIIQFWLTVLTIVFFILANGVAFTAMTFISIQNMNVACNDHLNSLVDELKQRDQIVATLEERQILPHEELSSFANNAFRNINCDLPGWAEDTVLMALDDTIFAANHDEYVGKSLSETLSKNVSGSSYEKTFEKTTATEYYEGRGLEISYLSTVQSDCVHLGQEGAYQLALIVPASETFLHRPLYMSLVAAVFALMFGAITLVTMQLLYRVIIRPIGKTNESLKLITDGDLTERVPESDSSELSSLSAGINTTVSALEDSIAEANARIDRELAAASAIQESALPSAQTPFPHIDSFDLYASMDPAREIGGDFYDFFEMDEDHIGFVVADVSGKGIPAALFMMAAKSEIRSAMDSCSTMAEAISMANKNLCEGNDAEMFVTVFAGVLNHRDGSLTYVNAGHNKPLVMQNNTWRWLEEKSGPMLASFDWVEYKQFETKLQKGDELFVYTDGVNEAFNSEEEQFGNDRLEAYLVNHSELHPRQLQRAFRAELGRWAKDAEQSDDITMLVLKYGIPPEHGASFVTEADLATFPKVENFLTEQLEEAGCPPKESHMVLMAAEELIVNVCNYAYEGAEEGTPQPLRVHFTRRTSPNMVVLEISDAGVPFNPFEREDPERPKNIEETKIGGLGITMTKELMDAALYVREGVNNISVIAKRWE